MEFMLSLQLWRKMALWYTEMKRNLKRFKEVRKEIEVGK